MSLDGLLAGNAGGGRVLVALDHWRFLLGPRRGDVARLSETPVALLHPVPPDGAEGAAIWAKAAWLAGGARLRPGTQGAAESILRALVGSIA